MSVCVECGKQLDIFRGYRHPTLGKKNLVCSLCFDTVQHSLNQWMEFILSNSFNQGPSRPLSRNQANSPFNKISRDSQMTNVEQQTSPSSSHSKTSGEMALTHLKYHHNDPLTPVERRTV